MDRIRLDKYLCDLGIAPRSECRRIIRSGRVRVDGEAVSAPETKLDPLASAVTLDGERLVWTEHHYYMMNKPAGVLTATEDRLGVYGCFGCLHPVFCLGVNTMEETCL